MATNAATAKRQIWAMERIESGLERLAADLGVEFLSIPKRHRDPEILRALQLETFADIIETISAAIPEPEIGYADMTAEELAETAEKLGIYDAIEGTGKNGNILKVDLIEALELYDAGEFNSADGETLITLDLEPDAATGESQPETPENGSEDGDGASDDQDDPELEG